MFCVEFCIFSANFWWNFFRISRQIQENSDVCQSNFFQSICENKSENSDVCQSIFFQSNLRKQIRNLREILNLWKLFTIIQNYSLVSLGRLRRPNRFHNSDLRLAGRGARRSLRELLRAPDARRPSELDELPTSRGLGSGVTCGRLGPPQSWKVRSARDHSNHFEPFEPFEFFQNRNFPEFFLRN